MIKELLMAWGFIARPVEPWKPSYKKGDVVWTRTPAIIGGNGLARATIIQITDEAYIAQDIPKGAFGAVSRVVNGDEVTFLLPENSIVAKVEGDTKNGNKTNA